MKIKHVKPGDVIKIKLPRDASRELKHGYYMDSRWIVTKVYDHVVLAYSKKCPSVRRCFNIGDLVILKLEGQEMIRRFEFDFAGSEVESYGEL